jgi:pyruvate,water dikinase
MYNNLTSKGILIPSGFAITAEAFEYFINSNNLRSMLNYLMKSLEPDFSNLAETGADARELIMKAHMPNDLGMAVISAYDYLTDMKETPVAVRSSGNDDTIPFKDNNGFHESYLNVQGHCSLLYSIRQCFASLFSDKAIRYRQENGMSHYEAFNSIVVQKMVRSDKSCSGIGYTSYPSTAINDILKISGIWGMAGGQVQEKGIADEFLVFKPSVKPKELALIEKRLGTKANMLVYADDDDESNLTLCKPTTDTQRSDFVINNREIEKLAAWATMIEDQFKEPMRFEWAKDGENNQLYIIGARAILKNSDVINPG